MDSLDNKMLEDYFKEISEKYSIEEKEIETKFQKVYDHVLNSPSMKNKPKAKQIKRAKKKFLELLANRRDNGETVVFIPFGYHSRAYDWNGEEIKTIQTMINGGKIPTLLREEKILYMMENGQKVPVSKVKKWGKRKVWFKDNKKYLSEVSDSYETDEWYVAEGEPVKSGQTNYVMRDSRYHTTDKTDKFNFNWSKELKSNPVLDVWGMGFKKSDPNDTRLVHFQLKHSQAVELDPDFFFRNYEPFKIYESEFLVVMKDGVFDLKYNKRLDPRNSVIQGVDDTNIDDTIELNLNEIRELYKNEGVTTYVPEVIYIDGAKDYHMSTVIRDANGDPDKGPKGYDKTQWGKYAILLADLAYPKYSNNPKKKDYFGFGDGDVDYLVNGFGEKGIYGTDPIQKGKPVIALVRTSRGTDRYDRKLKISVPDPDNADITFNVYTMRELPPTEVEELEEDFL